MNGTDSDDVKRLGKCENAGCSEPVTTDDDYVRLQHGFLHRRCTTKASRKSSTGK